MMRYDVREHPIYSDRWVVVDTKTQRRYPMPNAELAGRVAVTLDRYGIGSHEATRALYEAGYLSAADLVEVSGRHAGDVYGMILDWEGGDHDE